MKSTAHLAPGARVLILSTVPDAPAFRGFYVGPNVSAVGELSDVFSVVRVPHKGARGSSLSVVSNERIS